MKDFEDVGFGNCLGLRCSYLSPHTPRRAPGLKSNDQELNPFNIYHLSFIHWLRAYCSRMELHSAISKDGIERRLLQLRSLSRSRTR